MIVNISIIDGTGARLINIFPYCKISEIKKTASGPNAMNSNLSENPNTRTREI
jgi:hypothetical protein